MKKLLILGIVLLFFTIGRAQESSTESNEQQEPTKEWNRASVDSLLKSIRGFFDEVLDVDVGWAALQARHISNVGYGIDNTIGLNSELRDTLEFLRNVIQSELFVKSMLQYDHFWPNLINRKDYSPKERELNNQYDELYSNELFFDIIFRPAWDTISMDPDAARKANKIAYTCEIKVNGLGKFTAELSEDDMTKALNETLAENEYKKIKREAGPDVNEGMFAGLGWLAEKFGFKPFEDPVNIKRVDFYAPVAQNYGYDEFESAMLSGNYDFISIKGKQYYVPWKSAAVTKTDTIYAVVKKKEADKPVNDTVNFTTTTGLPVSMVKIIEDTIYRIVLPTITSSGEFGLVASYSYPDSTGTDVTVTAGQANIIGYNLNPMNVVIVPVAGSSLVPDARTLKNSLDAIYQQAATTWTVTIAPELTVDGIDINNLDDGESDMLTNYSDEMNQVIDAFQDQAGNIDKNTCYLFMVNRPTSGNTKLGYMPLKRQFGFIFTGNITNNLEHTIAHELGHGPFRLYHTFSDKNQYTQAQGSTKNLMDYAEGSDLYKYQWDLIHDPESMIALFQDEEEGEAQLWADPVCMQKKLEYFRWAYVNEEYAEFVADGYPHMGHYAEDIVLLNGIHYDKVHVSYISTVKFYPFKKEYTSFKNGITIKYIKDDGYGALSFSAKSLWYEALKGFEDYLFPTKEQYTKQINVLLNRISDNSANGKELLKLLAILPSGDYYKIPTIDRMNCLLTIASGSITERSISCINDEEIVISLIKSTPESQLSYLFSKLQENNLMQELCSKIQNAFGEENYTKFIGALVSKFMIYRKDDMYNVMNNWSEYSKQHKNGKGIPHFTWNKSSHRDFKLSYKKKYENNKLIFESKPGGFANIDGGYHTNTRPPIDPFEIVTVYFATPPTHISENIPADIWLVMPAFMFEWYLNEYKNIQIAKYFDGAATIAGFIIPITSISKGYKVLAIIHSTIGAINVALLNDRFEDIVQTYLPPESLEYWQSFSYLVSIAGSPFQDMILQQHFSNATQFFAFWNAFKNTEEYGYLLNEKASKEAIILFEGLYNNIETIINNEYKN